MIRTYECSRINLWTASAAVGLVINVLQQEMIWWGEVNDTLRYRDLVASRLHILDTWHSAVLTFGEVICMISFSSSSGSFGTIMTSQELDTVVCEWAVITTASEVGRHHRWAIHAPRVYLFTYVHAKFDTSHPSRRPAAGRNKYTYSNSLVVVSWRGAQEVQSFPANKHTQYWRINWFRKTSTSTQITPNSAMSSPTVTANDITTMSAEATRLASIFCDDLHALAEGNLISACALTLG